MTIESMSIGRPVIMFDIGDRYPVINQKTGFLINQKSQELLDIILYALNNKNEIINMSAKCREVIKNEFSNEVLIPKLDLIYKQLI